VKARDRIVNDSRPCKRLYSDVLIIEEKEQDEYEKSTAVSERRYRGGGHD
jgi:hypothetical protein